MTALGLEIGTLEATTIRPRLRLALVPLKVKIVTSLSIYVMATVMYLA
jgi:hypothetical protein